MAAPPEAAVPVGEPSAPAVPTAGQGVVEAHSDRSTFLPLPI